MSVSLDELHPDLDPYRCEPCLHRGDSCPFHAGLALGLDLAVALFLLDPQDVACLAAEAP